MLRRNLSDDDDSGKPLEVRKVKIHGSILLAFELAGSKKNLEFFVYELLAR
jgi:hypothetical protein